MVKNFNLNLIKKSDSLLLAVSGGIDSMVMLDIINKMKSNLDLEIYIAHVDHQKRLSSKSDREFVVNQAEKLNIKCFVKLLDNNNDDNFHNYAHKQRYEFFSQIAKDNNINKIVLAHNANDNAETILMRLIRGSSYEGYRGILETSWFNDIQIIRPMLNMSRSEIINYQVEQKIEFQLDPTNNEDDYTRNRFRHQILPLLESENPKFLDKLSQFTHYQELSYNLINDLSDKYLKKIIVTEKAEIDITSFKKLSEIIQIDCLKKIINILTNNNLEISFQNFSDILDLIKNSKPHAEFAIENKLYIYKSYDKLSVQIKPNKENNFSYLIKDFQKITLPNGYLVNITKKPNKNYGFIYKLCYNNLDLLFPLTIRNRHDGDRVITKAGTKKLKDILIDKKVPILERNSLPLILNNKNEIIYIPSIYEKDTVGENEIYIAIEKG
jgi:tRNA(Ile)-lysidine synthetase-like protein